MRVTILGKSPSWQDAGGACSGYLVREGDLTLLLDCGSGVFATLRRHLDYRSLDAILVTHLHPDHFIDLVPFSFALGHSPRAREAGEAVRPELHVPPGARDAFRALMGLWDEPAQLEEAFALREYDPAGVLTVGPLRVRFCEVPHYTRCWACELTTPEGRRFVFGADCAPNAPLVTFARGCDLLMLEATLGTPETSAERGHMLAVEAGELARRAGAKRLVLTHFTDELDPAWVRAEGATGFGGDVTLAAAGDVYEV